MLFLGKRAFLENFEWGGRICHHDDKKKVSIAPPGLQISEGCRFIEVRSSLSSAIGIKLLNEDVDWTSGALLSISAFVF